MSNVDIRHKLIMAKAKIRPRSLKDMVDITGASTPTLRNDIKTLCERGQLRRTESWPPEYGAVEESELIEEPQTLDKLDPKVEEAYANLTAPSYSGDDPFMSQFRDAMAEQGAKALRMYLIRITKALEFLEE